MADFPKMMDVKATAEQFGLSVYAVRMLLLSGQVHGVRIGRGKLLCNCDDLARYLSESYVNEPETDAPKPGGIRPVSLK